jgi:hypothetical protein
MNEHTKRVYDQVKQDNIAGQLSVFDIQMSRDYQVLTERQQDELLIALKRARARASKPASPKATKVVRIRKGFSQ